MSTRRLFILFYLLTITTFIQVDAKIVARATCDDVMRFYADGVLMARSSDWTTPKQVDLPDNTTVLGVYCLDKGGISGIHVTYTINQIYTTDTSWKCSAKFEENWSTPGFDDGNWSAASIVYETLYYRTDWIWTAGYNGKDKVVYCRKKIKVEPIIKALSSDAVDNIIDESSSVTFTCSVESFPVARVSWSRSQQGGQLYSGSQYTIPKASCQHTDNYTCTASNGIGQPVSKTIPLFVRCAPVVITKDVIVASRGETATLSIHVLAYPLPVFTWYYHKQDVRHQPITMVTGSRSKQRNDGLSSTLTIQDVKYEDGGIYTVHVINSVGTTSKTYTLSVISNEDDVKETVDDNSRKEDTVKEAVDDKPCKEDTVKEAVDDKLGLGVGIAIGVGIGLVVSGVLCLIIWGIRKRRGAISSNDRNVVYDTVSPESRDITTRHRNSPGNTDDSEEYVNTPYTSSSPVYEEMDEQTMDKQPNVYLPLSNKRRGH